MLLFCKLEGLRLARKNTLLSIAKLYIIKFLINNKMRYYRKTKFYKELTPYLATAYAEGFCEGEGANIDEQLTAWQYIHDKGLASQLQGFFGRTVNDLLHRELIQD